jgi:hypothetical protein
MSASPCPRLFEAEAMRDGRLTGAERASFERHVAICAVCSREVRALDALGEALRANAPPDPLDELHARRERTRLLAAFDGALMTPERRRAPRWFVMPAAGVLLSLVVWGLWRAREVAPRPAVAAAVVRADGDAIWSSSMEGSRERVNLARGTLWIHVDHSSGERRLVVVLPDGELEDVGTTFTVSADADHTLRVSVAEGHVLLRLRGRPQVSIGPGDAWVPDMAAPVACVTAAPVAPVPSAQAAPSEPSSRPLRWPAPWASAPAPLDSSVEFRSATEALDRGDNHEAASLFAAFLVKHPHDRRAEDAAYLRVIALQRCRDAAGAKDAASEYLRLYPSGFRRVEMDQLSR